MVMISKGKPFGSSDHAEGILMSWKTFRYLATALNAAVFLPLWFVWTKNGVIADFSSLLLHLFISAIAVMLFTGLLLMAVHLTLFGFQKWHDRSQAGDKAARLVGSLSMGLLTVAVISFALLSFSEGRTHPFLENIFGISAILGVVMFFGALSVLLPQIISFQSMKRSR